MLNNVTRPKGHVEFHRVLCKLVSLSLSELALVIKKARVKPVDNKIDLIGEEDLAVAPLAAAYERLRVPPPSDICDRFETPHVSVGFHNTARFLFLVRLRLEHNDLRENGVA